jgi:hypothetical protein
MNWLKVLTTKKVSDSVLTKYINEPINCLYIVGSTKSESEAPSFFRLVIISVFMDLPSIISNLLSISTTYFPCPRKILPDYCHTSNPKK